MVEAGFLQRCPAMTGNQDGLGTACNQCRTCQQVAVHGGHHQRGHVAQVASVDVRIVGDKMLDDIVMAIESGPVQRSESPVVFQVHIGTEFEKEFRELEVAIEGFKK